MQAKAKQKIHCFTLPKGVTREYLEIWIDGKRVRCVRQNKLIRVLGVSKRVATPKFIRKSNIAGFKPLKPMFKTTFPQNNTKR